MPFRGKFSLPQTHGPIARPRLFERLDRLSDYPVTWIVGAPGSGKTTLASTYLSARGKSHLWYQVEHADTDLAAFFHHLRLAIPWAAPGQALDLPPLTPDYLPGLTRFVRRYAEAMAERFKGPTIWVLDNYEKLPDDAILHEAMREFADCLPAHIRLLILSRREPAPAFARLRLHAQLAVLEGQALDLDPDEAAAFSAEWTSQSGTEAAPGHIAWAYEQSHGWVSGFLLLLAEPPRFAGRVQANLTCRKVLFDYFAAELLDHLPYPVREGLARAALLPAMAAEDVARITENPAVIEVLADLHRRHCFVTFLDAKVPAYRFHGLFRAFLLNWGKARLGDAAWRQVQKCAAGLLAAGGQPDAAAELMIEAEAWPQLAQLILGESPALLAAGRHRTVSLWVAALPPDLQDGEPWLLFWQAMARSPFAPVEARGLFERAYALFGQTDDAAGLYSSWAGTMETFFNEWRDFHPIDPWIDEYARLRARHPEFPSPEVELRTACAMAPVLFRRPWDPLVRQWSERIPQLLDPQRHLEMSVVLGSFACTHAGWHGDRYRMRLIVERLEPFADAEAHSPLGYILWRIVGRGGLHGFGGDLEAFRRDAAEALAMAERSGLHQWDFLLHAVEAGCCLAHGYTADAELALERARDLLPSHDWIDGSLHERLRANLAAQQGDWHRAAACAREAVRMAGAAGAPFPEALCGNDLARALFRLGRQDEARQQLDAVWKVARTMESRLLEQLCAFTEAAAAFQADEEALGSDWLARALSVSRDMDGPMLELGGPAWLEPLYRRALSEGIEVEHVRGLIRRFRFAPADPSTAPEAWPWPVRIFTLGRFEVLVDDAPLRSSRKAQQKPLDLLKALCAMGGRGVHQNRVIDALWPDAEGGQAEHVLSTTLYRLRKMLGREDAIVFEDRHLSLEPRLVWVDALAFGYAVQNSGTAGRSCLQTAFARYRGPFLPGESTAWATVCRERLRGQFLKLTARLCALLEQERDWQAAMDCCARVIDLEPTTEKAYRHLMDCHARLGQTSEAVVVFQRCQRVLSAQFGICPSQETQALYRRLIEG